MRLPIPPIGPEAAAGWVDVHLGDVLGDDAPPSPVFRGGQRAADASLEAFDVRGYARRRNEVWPVERRGASRLSPFIRHGLLPLSAVWDHVADGPARDVSKFRDELMWQEYARHLYARLGSRLASPLRWEPSEIASGDPEPWPRAMACMEHTVGELERDGWLVNQTRMWLASQWSVRAGGDWREGEERFFRHLLDGSRAANRLGWQWTVGCATNRPYGFSRWQVEKRAPSMCRGCALSSSCPIEDWPKPREMRRGETSPRLARDPDLPATRGPLEVVERGRPDAVWLTAESLGDADPARAAHPDRPMVFVFDDPLLRRLRLSRKRLVFLVETLAEIGTGGALEIHRGEPVEVLSGRRWAATFSPVPGWRRIAGALDLAAVHPWPWLVLPHAGPISSFSRWRREAERGAGRRGRNEGL